MLGWNNDRTIYVGQINKEDGEWLVGDDAEYFKAHGHPDDYPGLIAKDDPRRLMFKYWVANRTAKSQRYVGSGHLATLPAHDGRHELVEVLEGRFYCKSRGHIWTLGPPNNLQSITHAADEERRWSLGDPYTANPSDSAAGITLCYSPDHPLDFSGVGRGYACAHATYNIHTHQLDAGMNLDYDWLLITTLAGPLYIKPTLDEHFTCWPKGRHYAFAKTGSVDLRHLVKDSRNRITLAI